MKKASVFLLSFIILLSYQVGSVFAETPLNATVNDLIGTPYKYAGTTVKGFDCSGFTMYVFNKFDIHLVHSSKEQNKAGYWIPKEDLRTGDLVFFNTDGVGISHVGIYLSNGEFIHSSSNHGVMKSKLSEKYYVNRYVSARRILTNDMFKKLTTDMDAKVESIEAANLEDSIVANKAPETKAQDNNAAIAEAKAATAEETAAAEPITTKPTIAEPAGSGAATEDAATNDTNTKLTIAWVM